MKTHYGEQSPHYKPGFGDSLCGWKIVPVTLDVAAVGCGNCKRELRKRAAEAAARPFEPTGPVPASLGMRVLSEAAMRALEQSIRGETERRYTWRSASEALRELLAFREDGQGIGSTSAPARFERAPRGRTDPTRQVAGQVDRIHTVQRALDAAYEAPRAFTWTDCACGEGRGSEAHQGCLRPRLETVTLGTKQQAQVLCWALAERIVHEGGRPTVVSVSVESVCDRAREAWGVRLSAHHVALIRDAGIRRVAAQLVAAGEMAPPPSGREREIEMARVLGYDLSGWDAIEEFVGMSRDTLRKLMRSDIEDDRPPIYEIPHVKGYHAKRDELTAWVERIARPAGSAA